MKINNNFSNIFFQKKLIANCKVGIAPHNKDASIYQLEYPQDMNYYEKCQQDENWKSNFYLMDFKKNFEIHRTGEMHYVMEDLQGNLICASVLDEHDNDKNFLRYIETAPKLSSYNQIKRTTKYIGETMLAFLVKLSKNNKNTFSIPDIAQRPKTVDFYTCVCKFNMDEPISAYLNKENFDDFIDRNKKHTGNEIRFPL